MAKELVEESESAGLQMNSRKTKILSRAKRKYRNKWRRNRKSGGSEIRRTVAKF